MLKWFQHRIAKIESKKKKKKSPLLLHVEEKIDK